MHYKLVPTSSKKSIFYHFRFIFYFIKRSFDPLSILRGESLPALRVNAIPILFMNNIGRAGEC